MCDIAAALGTGWDCSGGPITNPCMTLVGHGVLCSGFTVTGIQLPGAGLVGSIPSSIGYLTSLTTLMLSSNSIQGVIPSSIGVLTALVQLYLQYNLLTGVVPSTVGGLLALTILDLRNNGLSGEHHHLSTCIIGLITLSNIVMTRHTRLRYLLRLLAFFF